MSSDISPAASTSPEQWLQNGRVDEALQAMTVQVRRQPDAAVHRAALFQLLALRGQWQRAEAQLRMAQTLDGQQSLLASAYGYAIRGELQRIEVTLGMTSPTIAGAGAAWKDDLTRAWACMIEANPAGAATFRGRAFEQAEPVAGVIDEVPFQWMADADPRFGPCLEVILKSGYAWVPFAELRCVEMDPPAALRDCIWRAARLHGRDGHEAVGFIPCRYPGTEHAGGADLVLARRTEWMDRGHGYFTGIGQRMLATDQAEYALLDVRRIVFGASDSRA